MNIQTPNLLTCSLVDLFNFQVARLTENGVDPAELESLRQLIPTGDVCRGEGIIPLLIVPRWQILLTERVAKIVLDGKTGTTYFDQNHLTNIVEIPEGHYLALNFEDGRSCLNTRPSVNHEKFVSQGRSSAVVNEGTTACIIFPEILRGHFIDFPGSRYSSLGFPCLNGWGSKPKLHASCDCAGEGGGSASVGKRLGL